MNLLARPDGQTYPPRFSDTRLLGEVELTRSLDAALAHWDGHSDLWLFGYGSLVWNPGVPVLETAQARVHGYHRGLYMWSRVNRGTPEQPGLVLALDRGGSCPGLALRLAGPDARAHLEILWRREMAMGSYRPAWLRCCLRDGRSTPALAFVVRRDAPAYAGRLTDAVVRTVLQCAQGRYGTTHEYVARTVAALRASGIPDPALEALLARCDGQRGV